MSTSELDKQIETLKKGTFLKESEVKDLCARAREIFVEESNVQRVDAPVTVRQKTHEIDITKLRVEQARVDRARFQLFDLFYHVSKLILHLPFQSVLDLLSEKQRELKYYKLNSS